MYVGEWGTQNQIIKSIRNGRKALETYCGDLSPFLSKLFQYKMTDNHERNRNYRFSFI